MDVRVDDKIHRLKYVLNCGVAQLHLDPRHPGVLIPEKFKSQHHLALDISYKFEPPDLTIGDWGIHETLIVHGICFNVGVPWSALYAIVSKTTRECYMYPDDIPHEFTCDDKHVAPEYTLAGQIILREVVLDTPLKKSA